VFTFGTINGINISSGKLLRPVNTILKSKLSVVFHKYYPVLTESSPNKGEPNVPLNVLYPVKG